MKSSDWAKSYEPGARGRLARDGHVEGCVAAVKGNCGPLSADQRDGLFDACNKVLGEDGRPALSRPDFDQMMGRTAL